MLTAKRLYLYSVLFVSLMLLLWGLADLARFLFDELAHAVGSAPAFGGTFAGEELSRALALGLVAGITFVVHLLLVRRTLHGSPPEVADERASASRSTYFFLALSATGVALLLSTYELVRSLLGALAFGLRGYDLAWPLGGIVVFGAAWVLHLVVRRTDLRVAPGRLAGDWLTRAYLYGGLLVLCLIAALQLGAALTVAARGVLDLQPAWASNRWWEEAAVGPVAASIAASTAWLIHWLMAGHLLAAPDPMGAAHRLARTRRGYFLVLVLVSATSVLVFTATGLQHLLAELLGTWRPNEGSRLVEDIGGPLLVALPFAVTWWWHLRRAALEAARVGGATVHRAVTRTGRLVVAFVGLSGLVVGLAWQLRILLATAMADHQTSLFTSGSASDDGAAALAVALVGLVIWTPAWALSQRERAGHSVEAAMSGSRRGYLMLVSGLAVVALMGSLAYLVWQGTRALLESGTVGDTTWAFAILGVATVVLGYHLWQLRADLALAPAIGAGEPVPGEAVTGIEARARETIEISAPAGADFKVLNAAIRTELPDGYELRIVG